MRKVHSDGELNILVRFAVQLCSGYVGVVLVKAPWKAS